jgi:3,4-dihydroxy 2-butanone 4-phosphate synthase/GTP cyclohydrolase II
VVQMSMGSAVAALSHGQPVLLVDGSDPESGADFVATGATVTAELMAYLVRHGSGLVFAAMSAAAATRLGIPPMVWSGLDPAGVVFGVTVDAASGISTGVSAADRAFTLRSLADRSSGADDFCRPGHVMSVRTHPDGLAGHAGRAEAAVELVGRAAAGTVAATCRLVSETVPTELATLAEAMHFAERERIAVIDMQDLLGATVARIPISTRALRPSAMALTGVYERKCS